MKHFFSESNWLYRFLSRLADWMILSLLWCVCSLPIITIGVSTTALYFVALQLARGEEPPIVKTFFRSFRVNLKQGLVLGIIVLAAIATTAVDYYAFRVTSGTISLVFAGFSIVSVIILALILPYLFPLLAQFNNTVAQMIKNAFVLSIANLPTTVSLLLIHAVPVLLALISWELFLQSLLILLVLLPAGVAYFCAKRINRIFMPLMSPPDSAEEAAPGE